MTVQEPPAKTHSGLLPQVSDEAVGSHGDGPQLEPVGVLVHAHLLATHAPSDE